ncbi:MAG: TcaA NTF2-like domain-containing protein [Cellulosilyticaceae bacterium]
MRLAKRELVMVGILSGMCLATVMLFRLTKIPTPQETTNSGNVRQPVVPKNLTKYKEEMVYSYVEQKIEYQSIKGITLLDKSRGKIETDGCGRYYTEMDVVGINSQLEVAIYTYCVVIQENKEGEFYIMPYGFEVIRADMESLKKDIITSTMKVANDWGVSISTPDDMDFEKTFSIQKINRLIVEFLESYANALEIKDFEQISAYFKADTPYFYKQRREFNQLIQSAYYCDIRGLQILNIAIDTQKGCFEVTIKGDLYLYLEEAIVKQTLWKAYQVVLENEELRIIGERLGR